VDIAQLPVVHAQNILPDRTSSSNLHHMTDVTSGQKAQFPMVIGRRRLREHPQSTFCTTTKKRAREKTGHAQNILSVRAASGDVTSGQKAPLGRILRNFRLHMHRILLDRASSRSTTTNVVLSVPIYY
jgi:hypothetical protein